MAEPILIQGGTFDPVHFGHLRSALDVADALGIDCIDLLPCGTPAHRGVPGASSGQRLKMLQRAIEGEPRFAIDRRELDRQGPSYMVETARSLREQYGEQRVICLMMGMDAFLGLASWHQWQELPKLLNLVVTHRPGAVMPDKAANSEVFELFEAQQVDSPDALLAKPAGGILLLPVTQLDISATDIRARVAAGKSPRYLVPEGVLKVIADECLYRS